MVTSKLPLAGGGPRRRIGIAAGAPVLAEAGAKSAPYSSLKGLLELGEDDESSLLSMADRADCFGGTKGAGSILVIGKRTYGSVILAGEREGVARAGRPVLGVVGVGAWEPAALLPPSLAALGERSPSPGPSKPAVEGVVTVRLGRTGLGRSGEGVGDTPDPTVPVDDVRCIRSGCVPEEEEGARSGERGGGDGAGDVDDALGTEESEAPRCGPGNGRSTFTGEVERD